MKWALGIGAIVLLFTAPQVFLVVSVVAVFIAIYSFAGFGWTLIGVGMIVLLFAFPGILFLMAGVGGLILIGKMIGKW